MTATCSRCGATTRHDFPDAREHCSGCDRVPAFCRCRSAAAERVPLWIERQRANLLPAKELVA